MPLNIPDPSFERVVIVGGGFAGLTLARRLAHTRYQVVLLDKNNYHQFQPLFYQVAMAGLEPSSIVFPFRKVFQKTENVLFRVAEVMEVLPQENVILTDKGRLKYNHLVICVGADTNYYGNQQIAKYAIPMKSVSEALFLRNTILEDYEKALLCTDEQERESLMDIVIVGGGPTGVEVAGALAEMRENVMPKEYKELNHKGIDIYLIQSGDMLLKGMSDSAGLQAEHFLTQMGVHIRKNHLVTGYDGEIVTLQNAVSKEVTTIHSKKVIWAAGIIGNVLNGIPASVYGAGRRLKTNALHQVESFNNIYALGDSALLPEPTGKYDKGHPQVAQVAIQMAENLARNLKNRLRNQPDKPFVYRDLGSMATIGRHKAVVDLPFWRFQGIFAWMVWLFVHLFALIGIKNKLFIFINWVWSYMTYDQALRLIIRPSVKERRA